MMFVLLHDVVAPPNNTHVQGTPDSIGKFRLCAMHVCVLGGAMCMCLCVLPCQAHRHDKGNTQSEAHGGGRRKQETKATCWAWVGWD